VEKQEAGKSNRDEMRASKQEYLEGRGKTKNTIDYFLPLYI